MEQNKADIIVVGAGPAGVSAAITAARAGKKVLLLERGDNAGDKNMFGGCIYEHQTAEIFPDFKNSAPIERIIKEEKVILLTDNESSEFSYKHGIKESNNAYTVKRSKWDRWCAEEAQKEGVYFAPKTLVKHLIRENGVVYGVETEKEKIYGGITIIADGVNSLLAKEAGMRNEFKDKDMTVNVKEVYRIPREVLENRFNLNENEGMYARIFGGVLKNMFAMGFMYTNKDSVSLGVGISADEAKKNKINPSELLDKLKDHPSIKPYIKDGELIEYSSHMIPEGDLNIPKIYDNRVMIAGDAAGFVNNLHLEGTNLAMLSGKLAAETALFAMEKCDFSASVLSLYYKKLKESIILKDLKTHNDTVPFMKKNISTISALYPELACKFFALLSGASEKPKKMLYNEFLKDVISSGAIFKSIPLGLFAAGKCIKK